MALQKWKKIAWFVKLNQGDIVIHFVDTMIIIGA